MKSRKLSKSTHASAPSTGSHRSSRSCWYASSRWRSRDGALATRNDARARSTGIGSRCGQICVQCLGQLILFLRIWVELDGFHDVRCGCVVMVRDDLTTDLEHLSILFTVDSLTPEVSMPEPQLLCPGLKRSRRSLVLCHQVPCQIPWLQCPWHRCLLWMGACHLVDVDPVDLVQDSQLSRSWVLHPRPSQILQEGDLLQAPPHSQISQGELETWAWRKQDPLSHQGKRMGWAKDQTLERAGCSHLQKHQTGEMASGMTARDFQMGRDGVAMAGVAMAGVMAKVLTMAKGGVAKDGMVVERVGAAKAGMVARAGMVVRAGMEEKALEIKDLARDAEERAAVAKAMHHTECRSLHVFPSIWGNSVLSLITWLKTDIPKCRCSCQNPE